jgi:hypothetical protein
MRRVLVAVIVGALCTGCAGLERLRPKPEPRSEAAVQVARADQLVRDGQPIAARDVLARVAGEPERDQVHGKALYDLARLQVDPRSGARDYRAAQLAFKRLRAEYPGGEWDADARAWETVLADLAAREAELTARDAEVARLRSEAAKVGADLQRLKRIDLNLERRR